MSQLNLSDLQQTDLHQLDVVARYSAFAPVYDESVTQWGYQCYRTASQLLQPYVTPEQPILDAGCGTGLVGQALQSLGYQQLVGIDISPDMLQRAVQTGYYRQLLFKPASLPLCRPCLCCRHLHRGVFPDRRSQADLARILAFNPSRWVFGVYPASCLIHQI